MFKVAGFCKRYPALSHDEYRAAHGGYHVSLGRRLKGNRGYILNCWSDRDFESEVPGASRNEPPGFFDCWDGFAEIWFVDMAAYLDSRTGEADRGGPTGLFADDFVAALGADCNYLYEGAPHQFACNEHIIVPVVRPERRLTKLQQWGAPAHGLTDAEFTQRWRDEYAPLHASIAGLHGYTVTTRSQDDAMKGFFSDKQLELALGEKGVQAREQFYASWTGFGQLFLENLDAFRAFREENRDDLTLLESEIFDRIWYREIDEIVGVLPKRDEPLPVYQR